MNRTITSLHVTRALRSGLCFPLLLLAGSLGVGYGVWRVARPEAAHSAAEAAAAEALSRARALEAFVSSDASPLVEKAHQENLAAVKRATGSLDTCFSKYSEGAAPFAASLTGWGMRFTVLYRAGVETAQRKQEHSWTAQLVQGKFSEHVVSEPRLEADVMEVMKQFNYDLTASRNALMTDLEARLTEAKLPGTLKDQALGQFRAGFEIQVKQLLRNLPGQSVGIGIGSLAAGIVAQEAVQQMIRVVLAQAAARMATSAAASGGAAASAAAVGGAGGTLITPGVGTAIGLAGGFIAGAAVDWWMTAEFEQKIAGQCRSFLQATRDSLITGPQGLEALLVSEADRMHTAVQRAVIDSLRSAPVEDTPALP